eukprot:GFYU01004577.1.p3 GENE.GFYU01004577.1~~GFYU01004577.1.p3  ORF type:complete len:114 (-),score=21.41 GFYU01004577.1:274-615(-)
MMLSRYVVLALSVLCAFIAAASAVSLDLRSSTATEAQCIPPGKGCSYQRFGTECCNTDDGSDTKYTCRYRWDIRDDPENPGKKTLVDNIENGMRCYPKWKSKKAYLAYFANKK